MIGVKIYVDKPSRRRSVLRLVLSLGGSSDVFLPEKVNPAYWDKEDQKLRTDSGVPVDDRNENQSINTRLAEYKLQAQKIFDLRRLNDEPANHATVAEDLRFKIKGEMPKRKDFWGFVDQFIEQKKQLKGEVKSDRNSIINSYLQSVDLLMEYEKIYGPLSFKSFNAGMYANLMALMRDKKGYKINNAGKHIKVIRTFLNGAIKAKVTKEDEYKSTFKFIESESHEIYLNYDEIDAIANLRLDDEKYGTQRDLFIVGCYTGLRYSDFGTLKPHSFVDGRYIQKMQQKGGKKVFIAIHPNLKPILEKYDYRLPKVAPNGLMNRYLKEIGEDAGITDNIYYTEKTLKGYVERSCRKCDLIKTHTARRSLATNLYLSEYPVPSIMKITGHKTTEDFLKYIRVTDNEEVSMLEAHWNKTLSEKH